MRVSQFKDRVDALLSKGLRELSMTLAVLAQIENDNFEIVAVQSNSGAYVPGEKYSLGDSFSRQVFEEQKIIAETSIDNSPEILRHPLYRSLPLECYLGAPVTLHGRPWGCLDFSSMAQRDGPFTAQDLRLIESLAGEISALLCSIENSASNATANSSGP
ncbi:MAG: GAF domain-containing protein [Gammaproteobacteria bacterium]|nr:GAF domain-containing protein [Gammaproteobacteria bacterium]